MKRFRACSWSISGLRSSIIWSRAPCVTPPVSTSLRRESRRRQHSRGQDCWLKCRQAGFDDLFSGWRIGRPCGHGRSRSRAGAEQRQPRRRLWLYGHPRRLPGAAKPAGGYSRCYTSGRNQRQRRSAAAASRPARRLRSGAAGDHLRRGSCKRCALWTNWLSEGKILKMADGTIGLWTVPLAVFGGAIRVSTPFLFVSLGECITERSGRINLGLEGTLVMGAMSAYGISYLTGSPWLGVLAAGAAGALFG